MGLPNVWPTTSVINILMFKPGSEEDPPGYHWTEELALRTLRSSTYLFLAIGAYFAGYSWLLQQAANWHWQWVTVVIARNMLIIHLLYGGWHWFLYERKETVVAMRSQKFDPRNISEDGELDTRKGYDPATCRLWATSGVLIESMYECVMLHLWAKGWIPMLPSFWASPVWSVMWIVFVIYWRDFHFFFAHRLMHPYFPKSHKLAHLDAGRFLYRIAHSLHHKSYNTGPWSGLSMHPIEHLIYFSCVFVPSVFIAQHPIHFLFNHFHVLVSPLPGHDGYAAPGGGSFFHYLHHAHFECNYGTPMVPLDRIFGSYEDGSRYKKAA